MCLASRVCLVVLLILQGRAFPQGTGLLPNSLEVSSESDPLRPFPRRVLLPRSLRSATLPTTTRTSQPSLSPGKASGVISPPLDFNRLLNVGSSGEGTARESRLGPRLYWSLGLALAAGGMGWWSESRADRAYDHYLHSASLARQHNQFRRAERYDRLAGASFVFMEAGIVLSAYLVFF